MKETIRIVTGSEFEFRMSGILKGISRDSGESYDDKTSRFADKEGQSKSKENMG